MTALIKDNTTSGINVKEGFRISIMSILIHSFSLKPPNSSYKISILV